MANFLTNMFGGLFGKSNSEQNMSFDELAARFQSLNPEGTYPYWNFLLTSQFGFERCVIVYKSVMEVSRGVGGLSWYLRDSKTGEEIEDASHPLLQLITRPNPGQSRSQFFQHAVAYKLLDGNSFIEMVGPSLNPTSKVPPTQLWLLRPDWVQITPSGMRLPSEYIYTPGGADGGRARTYPVDQISGACSVLHLKSFAPLFEDQAYRGLSPVRAAIQQVLTHNEGNKWNHNLLKNGVRPTGVFTTPPSKEGSGGISKQQLEDLKKQIAENFGGAAKAGKPVVLTNGLQFQATSLNPKDADYLNLKNAAARDICHALGVPPQLLGIPGDNTFSNYQEARQAFYEETVLPEARALRDELNRWLSPLFGGNVTLEIDEEDISALASKRASKIAAYSNAQFLTINDKRKALGYPPLADGDVVVLTGQATTLAETVSGPPPGEEVDEEEEE